MCKHHFKIAVFRISYGKNRSMIGFKKLTNFKFSLFVFFLLTIIFYKSVELTTGVKFGKPFLDDVFGDGKITLNSLQPTIALSIVKEESPEHELRFAAMLLEHVYVDGIDPTDIEALAACAAKIGFDPLAFETKMKSFEYENAAKAEFKTFRNNKFSAMPALVLIKNGTEHQISHGYMNFEDLKTKLDSFLF